MVHILEVKRFTSSPIKSVNMLRARSDLFINALNLLIKAEARGQDACNTFPILLAP